MYHIHLSPVKCFDKHTKHTSYVAFKLKCLKLKTAVFHEHCNNNRVCRKQPYTKRRRITLLFTSLRHKSKIQHYSSIIQTTFLSVSLLFLMYGVLNLVTFNPNIYLALSAREVGIGRDIPIRTAHFNYRSLSHTKVHTLSVAAYSL